MNSLHIRQKNNGRGFTFIESLVYIAVLTMIAILTITTLLRLTRAWGFIQSSRVVNEAASFSLELMTREIRNASAIVAGSTTLDASPGLLTLTTPTEGGGSTTVSFALQNNRLTVSHGGGAASYAMPSGAYVSSLIFRQMDTPHSSGIRIEMTIDALYKGATTTQETFHSSGIMRGSYY